MRNFLSRSTPRRQARTGSRWRSFRGSCSVLCASAAAATVLAAPAVAEETPVEIIAAHIRMQGFACENALSAERDGKASKPNETVWTLRCSNGTYRVRLVPDMAAHVELVKSPKSD